MRAGDDDGGNDTNERDTDATSDNRHMDHDDSRGVNDSNDDKISLHCPIQARNTSSNLRHSMHIN